MSVFLTIVGGILVSSVAIGIASALVGFAADQLKAYGNRHDELVRSKVRKDLGCRLQWLADDFREDEPTRVLLKDLGENLETYESYTSALAKLKWQDARRTASKVD